MSNKIEVSGWCNKPAKFEKFSRFDLAAPNGKDKDGNYKPKMYFQCIVFKGNPLRVYVLHLTFLTLPFT